MNAADMRYPYGFDARGRTATSAPAAHVREMIELLLLTSPGERVNRPDFGGGLLTEVFAPNSPQLAAALELRLAAALTSWLGDVVELLRLTVAADEGRLFVEIEYALRATGTRQVDVIEAGVPA